MGQRDCTGVADASPDSLFPSPATLDAIRCHIDQGKTALAVLLLQQLLAADESNREAALLLEEQVAKAAGASPQPPVSRREESPEFTGWLAAEIGHDSNINRATSAEVIDIPLLNYRSLNVPELLVEHASRFVGVAGGATLHMPITATLHASLHGQASLRGNFAEVAYLPHNYFAVAQLEQEVASSTLGVGASMGQQWIAKYRLLERTAFSVRASAKPAAAVRLFATAEWASNAYPLFEHLATRENSIELRGTFQPFNLQLGAYWGREASRNDNKDLDRTFDGLSIGWRYPLTGSVRLAIDASSGQSRYGQFSRLFAARRADRQTDVTLALQMRLNDGWSLTPKLMLERNDSNISLNAYRRTQYLAELRKDF